MLEKTPESPLDCKEIKSVNPKGNQPWIFIGRTDAEAETPILWPPEAKSWLTGKDLDAVKNWGWEEKGETEDEMVGWHHRFNAHESQQTLGDSEGQGSLACCSPWDHKELDMTEPLNNNNSNAWMLRGSLKAYAFLWGLGNWIIDTLIAKTVSWKVNLFHLGSPIYAALSRSVMSESLWAHGL